MSMLGASYTKVLKITVEKCQHLPQPIRRIGGVNVRSTVNDCFIREHGDFGSEYKAWCVQNGESYDLEKDITFSDIEKLFSNNDNVAYRCAEEIVPSIEISIDDQENTTEAASSSSSKRCAFAVMKEAAKQKPKRAYPEEVNEYNRRTEMTNELLKDFKSRGLDFNARTAEVEGKHCLKTICDALWYVTNDHQTIADRCKHVSGLLPVPKIYEGYVGYNDRKRKKSKSDPMSKESLRTSSSALFTLLMKPYMKSTDAWRKEAENIELLAKCLHNYAEYLNTQCEKVKATRNASTPSRTLDCDTNIEFRDKDDFVDDRFSVIESALKEAGLNVPIIFDEGVHLKEPFENNVQRYRFFNDLRLSIPIDIVRFSPGGSATTIACFVYRESERNESAMLTDGAQVLQKMRKEFKEFHTRAQKRMFRKKVENASKISSALLEEIYKDLCLDASASSHPETGERVRAILLGETGLMCDMRHLNPGRATGTFDAFFEKMGEVIEDLVAADDRRHGQTHMSEFTSIKDLIDQVTLKCPEGTPIPSKSLVRLQFTPTNPYSRAALSFSSRFAVQHKIQRRQLRVSHQDSHYCNALFKYFKSRAVEMKSDTAVFFCDDKAKVSVGEPEAPVSTGVRGRLSIVPTTSTIVALDHDMHKASLTPNVVLECNVPDAVDKSFYRGKVTVSVSDSVFQGSDPFRHGVMLCNILGEKDEVPPTLMKFTDGGTDQRNNLEKVKCANICLFKKLDLDMIITARCAPGQSYTNPCERVMSNLNFGLQNCATEREKCDKETEALLKKCKSMDAIRNCTEPKVKEKWLESLKPVQKLIETRFEHLMLKDEPINCVSPVTEAEVSMFQRHLKELFPSMDLTKLQKLHTSKIKEYIAWKSKHCIENHYLFIVRKCEDLQCCAPSRLPRDRLKWLPSPLLDDSGEHYKAYESLKTLDVSDEKDRPSLKVIKPPKKVSV